MRLSALEIKKKEFQQKMRGADPEEVQAFLDQISAEVESLAGEKKELEDNLATVRERLDHYISLEQTIEKTLAAAQQTAVVMQEQAKKESELILRDAALERDRKMNDLRVEMETAERNLFRLKTEYEMTLSRMHSAVSSFSAFLNTLSVERETTPPATANGFSAEPVGVSTPTAGPQNETWSL